MKQQHLILTAFASTILSLGLVSCGSSTPDVEVATQPQSEVEMETQNLAAVKKIYADFEAGNIAGFIAALNPDMVWNEAENNLYAPDSPYNGIEEIMGGVFAPLGEDWEYFKVEPASYLSDGDQVAMFGRYRAKYNATGKTMSPQIVHRWTFTDGKVTAFQQHMDTLAQKDAMTP